MRNVMMALMVAGCGSKAQSPVEGAPAVAEPAAPLPRARPASDAPAPPVVGDAPEGTAELQSQLMAWHAEDLPTKDVLDHHPQPAESLLFIAKTGRTMVVRVRAMELLGVYPDAERGAWLGSIVEDKAQHASLRAGALRGIAGHDLGDAGLRQATMGALEDEDVRVQLAAVQALSGVEEAREALAALAASDGLDPRVKAEIDGAL